LFLGRILIDAFTAAQSSRYDFFKRAKLNKPVVRKIVNQTLSQSVPPNVITTISGYTKVFVGELVERARTVQEEWAEAADEAAIAAAEAEEAETEGKITAATSTTSDAAAPAVVDIATITKKESKDRDVKVEPSVTANVNTTIPLATQSTIPGVTHSASNTQHTKKPFTLPPNPHRGQLLPSHLREALRRYKCDCEGGNVGFSGMSTNGLGVKGSFVWNVRGVGGRRLFR
jgi:transcription initiation factor TFIID subunit 11